MNDGVKLILERLKTNPEDFLPSGRFRNVADNLMELAGGRSRRIVTPNEPGPFYFLTDEEQQLLKDAWIKCAREQFTVRILETLMAEEVSKDEYRYYPQSAGGLQIGGTYNTAAVTNSTIASNSLTAKQIAMQQQMLELELRARAQSMKEEFGNPLQNAYNQQAKQAK